MGIEDTNFLIADFALHPFGFVSGRLKRGMTMRGFDLARAGQPCGGDAKLRHHLLDDVDRLMRDLVHASCHRAAMSGIDVAERQAKLGGHHPAVSAARTPARLVGFEHNRLKSAFCDVMGC